MAAPSSDIILASAIGAIIGGVAATLGAYLALRHRAMAAERARMATEIMYHVMTAMVLLEEALAAVHEVLMDREKGRNRKDLKEYADKIRRELQKGFAGYDPLRPHVDYRVGKLMRLPEPAMKMLDELERRLSDAFRVWDGGRLMVRAAQGKDEDIREFDAIVTRSAEDVQKFAKVLRRV